MTHRTNLRFRYIAAVLPCAIAAAILLSGCGGGSGSGKKASTPGTRAEKEMQPSADTAAASPSAANATIDLVAENIAFDKSTITVPAGAQVTVNFENKDRGVPHNFAVYMTSAAKDQIFSGKIISGPESITYTFTAPKTPGDYFFRCDVHPNRMTGTLVVK